MVILYDMLNKHGKKLITFSYKVFNYKKYKYMFVIFNKYSEAFIYTHISNINYKISNKSTHKYHKIHVFLGNKKGRRKIDFACIIMFSCLSRNVLLVL